MISAVIVLFTATAVVVVGLLLAVWRGTAVAAPAPEDQDPAGPGGCSDRPLLSADLYREEDEEDQAFEPDPDDDNM
jgi:hypothetical protein